MNINPQTCGQVNNWTNIMLRSTMVRCPVLRCRRDKQSNGGDLHSRLKSLLSLAISNPVLSLVISKWQTDEPPLVINK